MNARRLRFVQSFSNERLRMALRGRRVPDDRKRRSVTKDEARFVLLGRASARRATGPPASCRHGADADRCALCRMVAA